MKPAIESFLSSLNEGSKPDLHAISSWLAKQKMNAEEWDLVAQRLCKTYNFANEDELSEHLKKPIFLGVSDYEDDFSPMMDDTDVRGMVRDYVEHTRGMEPPTAFHFATALTMLGASLRRNVFVDQGFYTVWPAMQTMLIGPSGKTKKSTAGNYGIEMLMRVAAESGAVNFLPDEGSGEALKTELAQLCSRKGEATGLLYVSELGTFLGKQEYNVNLVQMLTDLFDSRVSKRRRTHSQGNQKLKNIAVSFLGCSNEDWLADAIPASAFGGGFFGRMLVFYQSDTDRCFSRPRKPPGMEHIEEFFTRVQFIKGEAVLDQVADKWFDEKYKKVKKEWPEDDRLVPFWERIPDHLLRLSMLMSISEDVSQTNAICVQERHLLQADGVVSWILRYLPKVYSHLGRTGFGDDQQRIITILQRRGGFMEENELARKMARRMSRRRLNEHLETLKANGDAERVKLKAWEGKYGWKIIPGKEF